MRRLLRSAGLVLAALFVAHLGYVAALRWIDPPFTWTLWKARQELRGRPGAAVRHRPIPFSRMGLQAPVAIIAAEDQAFARHHGFDPKAIVEAIDYNRRHAGTRMHGGSTISQQTAKNVFLWPQRTWIRKGAEAWFTLLIETFWGKRRILEMYLNVAQMGEGVFGIEAAAQLYFGVPASKLTPEQAALIAAALPGPRLYNIAKPGPWLRKRRDWVLRQMGPVKDDPDVRALLRDRRSD